MLHQIAHYEVTVNKTRHVPKSIKSSIVRLRECFVTWIKRQKILKRLWLGRYLLHRLSKAAREWEGGAGRGRARRVQRPQ